MIETSDFSLHFVVDPGLRSRNLFGRIYDLLRGTRSTNSSRIKGPVESATGAIGGLEPLGTMNCLRNLDVYCPGRFAKATV